MKDWVQLRMRNGGSGTAAVEVELSTVSATTESGGNEGTSGGSPPGNVTMKFFILLF